MGSRQSFGVSGLELGIRGCGVSDADLLEVWDLELRMWNSGTLECWSCGNVEFGALECGISEARDLEFGGACQLAVLDWFGTLDLESGI